MDTTPEHECDGGWIEVVEARRVHMARHRVPTNAVKGPAEPWPCHIPDVHGDQCVIALVLTDAVARCPVCHPERALVTTTGDEIEQPRPRLPYNDN